MFSITENLRAVLPYVWKDKSAKHKASIVFTLLLVALTIVLNLSVPIIFKDVVNALAAQPHIHEQLTILLFVAYGLCWVAASFFEKFREIIFFRPLSTTIADYSLAVFKHLHSLSLTFHLDRETGRVAGAIQRSQLAIAMVVTNLLFRITPVFIEIVLAFIILWHVVGLKISIVLIATLLAYLVMTQYVLSIFKKAEKNYVELDIIVDKRVVDSLLNSENIKYLDAERHESNTVSQLFRKREDAITKVFWVGTFSTVLQAIVLGAGLTITSYFVGLDVLSGKLAVGDFVLVNGYLLLLFNPLESLTGLIRSTISFTGELSHSTTLLEESHVIEDMPGAEPITVDNAEIQFKDVCFSYDADHREILNHFNLHIPSKSTVAIVGTSGSGKSTISRLLFRFYDLEAGAIEIDGQDIKTVTKDSLRQNMAFVPQDIVLLNKSLQDNICYGNLTATDKKIHEVLKAVHLESFISKLPEGLDTFVGERGVKLSGGEKQRVAIARALLKNPKILVFDEATSSLDTKTESLIQQNIYEVTENITTILIAHRLSTVVNADMIVVLDKGQVAETGTHSELLLQNGVYAKLWQQKNAEK